MRKNGYRAPRAGLRKCSAVDRDPLLLFRFVLIFSLIALLNIALSGCAIYYRDKDSGADHIWGFGHLAMKATPPLDGKQALIRRTTLTGVAIGIDDGSFGLSVGWDRKERITVYDENTAITIQRPPSNDFFYFKLGTYPPELLPDNSEERR